MGKSNEQLSYRERLTIADGVWRATGRRSD
ncbi:hypothetical protein ACVWZA_004360 [Sphingomonas sp. UYAg733]